MVRCFFLLSSGGERLTDCIASGPPTFADLAVAGGCKSLFHQLYQSVGIPFVVRGTRLMKYDSQDQSRLQEEIHSAMASLAECDEALQHEQPKVFVEWSTASEAHRAIMQVRLTSLRTRWRELMRASRVSSG